MVAERHAIGAGVQELAADILGDAEAAGGILAVDDDAVERPEPAQLGQVLADRGAAGAADHVADKQQPHQPSSATRMVSLSVTIMSSGSSWSSLGTYNTSCTA